MNFRKLNRRLRSNILSGCYEWLLGIYKKGFLEVIVGVWMVGLGNVGVWLGEVI